MIATKIGEPTLTEPIIPYSKIALTPSFHRATREKHFLAHDEVPKVYLAVVGHGTVGGALLDQIVSQREELKQRKGVDLVVFAVAN